MPKSKENPILSLIFNLVLPVIILKNGDKWIDIETKLLGLEGNVLILLFALSFPTLYFLNDFRINSRANFISILGFVNVLLTGLIGIFGEKYGISRDWFIIKESMIPLIIGFITLLSMKSKTPLVKTLVYNETVFNIEKIKKHLSKEKISEFNNVFKISTYLISASFFLSAIIQFFLASYIVTVDPGHMDFNEQVGTMTWMSYFVVMIPCNSMFGYGIFILIKKIKNLTGLDTEQILNK